VLAEPNRITIIAWKSQALPEYLTRDHFEPLPIRRYSAEQPEKLVNLHGIELTSRQEIRSNVARWK
jgi:hypothetical protein